MKIHDKSLLYNLRFRWPKELERFNDTELIKMYDEFALSEDFGNNDEKFLIWANTY